MVLRLLGRRGLARHHRRKGCHSKPITVSTTHTDFASVVSSNLPSFTHFFAAENTSQTAAAEPLRYPSMYSANFHARFMIMSCSVCDGGFVILFPTSFRI